MPPFVIGNQAFPTGIVGAHISGIVQIRHFDFFGADAIQQGVQLFFCEILNGSIHGKAILPTYGGKTLIIPTMHIANIQRYDSAFADG